MLHSLALQLRFDSKAVGAKQIINDRIDIMLRANAEMQIQLGKNYLKSLTSEVVAVNGPLPLYFYVATCRM